jgi:hypothetical protein
MPIDSALGIPYATGMEKDALAERIIDALGGTKATADLCQIKPASVSGWRRHGIPKAREQYLRLLKPDAFCRADEAA